MWCATYRWKALGEGYNFASNLISIRGLHAKVWGPKVAGVSTLGILGLPKMSFGCGLRGEAFYKGENGGFPHVWAVVNFVSSSLPVACLNTKNVPAMH